MPSSTSPTPTSGRVWEHPRNGHLGPFPGPPVIAFDVGGTHLRCVVVEPDGTLAHFEKDRIVSVPSGAEPEEVKRVLVETMADYVARVQPALEPDSPIAVSVPAPADRSGVIYTAAPLFGETCPTFELGERVGRATGRPCHVVNDVSAAAWYLSERMAADRFLVVTVSSSIGCKVFDRSRRYAVLDDTDYAGEIGHVTVDETPDAPRCDCGGRGHLSAVASGRGVERAVRRAALADQEGFQASRCASGGAAPETLCNEAHIVPAIRAGDPWTMAILRACTHPLGHMLRVIAVATAVERIVVIGGFARELGNVYLDVLQEILEENADFAILRPRLRELLWREAEVPEECLLGAATYGRAQTMAPVAG